MALYGPDLHSTWPGTEHLTGLQRAWNFRAGTPDVPGDLCMCVNKNSNTQVLPLKGHSGAREEQKPPCDNLIIYAPDRHPSRTGMHSYPVPRSTLVPRARRQL